MFKVMKGRSRTNGKLDSTYTKKKDAEKRLKMLCDSNRGNNKNGKGRTIFWIEPAQPEDPINRKPKKNKSWGG